ncbi:MFS transporter [Pararhizobium sp.]|uniref:MFS transporter n=1 Tax=Pararhizobium sp. TaxID=1977563 RepID=UPI00271ED85A|nr:MFS transporter [Pararhizobium sp.]MDO9414727.1 MFS transporter [Pararhizobium sp.]
MTGNPSGGFPENTRRYVLITAILASSMAFIDGSVLSIATPAIRADLGASLSQAQWISNGYMLLLASMMLIGGAAGDRFGLRRVFGLGIAVFTISSGLCAFAPSTVILIAARVLQGLGAALMVPGSLAIIAKAYPKDKRGQAIGLWATASSLMSILGPVIGGFVLTALGDWSWRLVFAINLPLGLVALAMLWLRVPADPPSERRKLDLIGGGLVTAALLLIALGLTGEPRADGTTDLSRALIFCGTGIALFIAFIVWESRTASPMLPLRLFASRGFSGANALTFTLYFLLSAIMFYLPMALIGGWGVTPANVSLALLPLGILLTLMSSFTGKLADRFGAGPPIAGGSLIVALGFAGLGLSVPFHSLWLAVTPMMVLIGIGMGFVVSPLSTAVMVSVSDEDTGVASGVNNAVARVAGLVAVAAMGALVAFVFEYRMNGVTGLSFGQAAVAARNTEALRVAATDGAFAAVAYVTAILSLVSAVIAWTTLARTATIS